MLTDRRPVTQDLLGSRQNEISYVHHRLLVIAHRQEAWDYLRRVGGAQCETVTRYNLVESQANAQEDQYEICLQKQKTFSMQPDLRSEPGDVSA